MMSGKKAILTVRHLSKENHKMKLLAYYEIHFGVERVRGMNATLSEAKPRKPNRPRSFE